MQPVRRQARKGTLRRDPAGVVGSIDATHSLTSLPNDVAMAIASLKLALPPIPWELGKEVPKELPSPMREEPDAKDEEDPPVDDSPGGTRTIGMGAGIAMPSWLRRGVCILE